MDERKLSIREVQSVVRSLGLETALATIRSTQMESLRLASYWEQLQVTRALVDGILAVGDDR